MPNAPPRTPPREFFEENVRRSLEDFRAHPSEDYYAKIAVERANIMAERMWHFYKDREPSRVFGANSAGAYRAAIVEHECNDFVIIRDIADGFKHAELNRPSRRVTSAVQTGAGEITWTNARGEVSTFVNDEGEEIRWAGTVAVQLDDGTRRPVLPMLEDVVRMWDRLSV